MEIVSRVEQARLAGCLASRRADHRCFYAGNESMNSRIETVSHEPESLRSRLGVYDFRLAWLFHVPVAAGAAKLEPLNCSGAKLELQGKMAEAWEAWEKEVRARGMDRLGSAHSVTSRPVRSHQTLYSHHKSESGNV